MKKIKKEELDNEVSEAADELKEFVEPNPELIKLLELLDQLKALGVNSISDLEVKIARLQ